MNRKEDLQPATSRLTKIALDRAGNGGWALEVRTEDEGAGTRRLGELILHGYADGRLTAELREGYGLRTP